MKLIIQTPKKTSVRLQAPVIALFSVIFMLFFNYNLSSQQINIINNSNRVSLSLNGKWNYVVDPYETGYYDYRRDVRDEKEKPSTSEALFLGHKPQSPSERVEYNFDKSDIINVPGDWNSQKEKLFYYEGSIWYYKAFDYNLKENRKRQFIHFGAANYETDVYLNGKKLGKHLGGFTPFNYEISKFLISGRNFIIVKVDNTRGLEKVPTINTDWWNYGGLTREVNIIEVPATFIQDYYIQLLKNDKNTIEVSIVLNGIDKVNKSLNIEIPEAKIKANLTTDAKGIAKIQISTKNLNLWSPENPHLYEVILSNGEKKVIDKIGFRTIDTKDSDIILNGKSVFLRGISIHEENGIRGGRAYSEEDARLLLGWAKELGCNFVRLAHYPHNENMTKVADEIGLMLWCEVPVYWTIQWSNEETYKNAENQLRDMIFRDKNKASVIIWSMANETPVSNRRTEFLKKMIKTTRSLDSIRLVSAALERHTMEGTVNTQIIADPLQEFVDVISFNEYIGWYAGLPDDCKSTIFDIKFNKPVIISEFGGGALFGNHGSKDALWTEEFQEDLYKQTLVMLDKIPQLRGITPWILTDFRSPRRLLPEIQDGWNRKGILSEKGEKKKAFYVLQQYYIKKKEEYK